MTDFSARHAELLSPATEAIGDRGYWSAYPETASGKIYGETAKAHSKRSSARRLRSTPRIPPIDWSAPRLRPTEKPLRSNTRPRRSTD
jgi:hypothetical protein